MPSKLISASAGVAAVLSLAVGGIPAFAQAPLNFTLGATGLTSLKYNGVEFLSYGDLRVNSVLFNNGTYADLNASTTADNNRQEVTRSYSWGSIKIGYSASASRLNLTITTTNTSPFTIQGVSYEPVALRFPQAPAEYDGNTPLISPGLGGPTLVQMSFGSGVMVFANDNAAKPLMAGFPWALNKPSNTIFPLRINTDRENMYPTFFPTIVRPIAPGASDQYNLSLRFGPPGSTLTSLGMDVYQAFAAAFPKQLNWSDHRGIGMLVLATAAAGWATNPRGYFLDPTVNVTTPAGVAAFQSRVLAYADSSIAILKSMNAQGAITWDIEGEQYPHATTYACDPTMLSRLAPEMDGIADAYFKKFRDAGLRVGVCVRPQQLVVDSAGARQLEVADPASLLISKIGYAKSRWGATLFYVDSNGGPNDPIDPTVFQRVLAAYPDILLVPEHKNTQYYAYTAPYRELRSGYAATAPEVRLVYPGAMSTVSVPDGDIAGRYNDLVNAVKQGDVLMFRAWFDDQPANRQVKSIYQTAGTVPATPVDGTPPAVTITAPGNGATVSGLVTFSATATDNAGVSSVQFAVDGAAVGVSLTAPPFSTTVNSSLMSNGSHVLSATARDTAGNTGSASVSVTVANAIPDTTPPNVSLTTPSNGALVSGRITISAAASDNTGVAGVQFKVDGNNAGSEVQSGPYSITFDTTPLGNGTHTVTAVARDVAGNTNSAVETVSVNNVTTPTLSCVAPASNAFTGCYYNDRSFSTLALVRQDNAINFNWGPGSPDPAVNTSNFSVRWQGSFVFTGGAYQFTLNTDDGSLLYIDNQLMGGNWNEHMATPIMIPATLTAGIHLIRVDYFQANGLSSAVLSWTGGNTAGDTVAPAVSLSSPGPASTVSGTTTVAATATDNVGVAGVQFRVDGNNIGAELTTPPYTMGLDTTTLANGSHTITAVARDGAGNRTTSAGVTVTISNAGLSCSVPGVNAFLGCYYSDNRWNNLVFTRTDAQINFNWGFNAPDPRVPQSYFSARWLGNFMFSGGNYRFTLTSDDGSLLYIDNQLVVNAWGEHPAIPLTATVALTPGTHSIRVDYYQGTGSAVAGLAWTPVP